MKIIEIKRLLNPFKNTWEILLLCALVLAIFIVPVFPEAWHQAIERILITIIFLTALLALEKRQKWLITMTAIAFFMEIMAGIFDFIILAAVSKSVNVVFFIIVIFRFIIQIAKSKQVSLRAIAGSIIGYLMLGLISSLLISFVMQHDPDAFNISKNFVAGPTRNLHLSESMYYSFVSMATLGYGDIVPLKPYSRSLAIFITVAGQLYLATIIALLVGKFSAQKS